MQLSPPRPLRELADFLGAEYLGASDALVLGINEIHNVGTGDLTFCDVAKYLQKALDSPATFVLTNQRTQPPPGKALLFSDDPFRDFNRLLKQFQPLPQRHIATDDTPDAPYVSFGEGVRISEEVTFGEGVQIGANCVIGAGVQIGAGTVLQPNVTVYPGTTIGAQCIIHSGAVLGADAYYYKAREWGREKLFSAGRTVIEDRVEIGANVTIDRGVTAVTHIGELTKIDNLVQIGHDTRIGKRVLIAAQAGIAGNVVIEDDVQIWAQAGVAQNLHLGQGCVLMARAAAMHDLQPGVRYLGTPAKPHRETLRQWAALRQLPQWLRKLES